MDSYEGVAVLEWWANRSTCLGRAGVRVSARVTEDGWTCDAVLDPPLSGEEREGFDFLMELDPVFTLRFDEGSTLLVDAAAAGDGTRLVLTAYQAQAQAQAQAEAEAGAESPGSGQVR